MTRPKAMQSLTPEQFMRALKRQKQKEKAEQLARSFVLLCVQSGFPKPVREFYFAAPERQWRSDFAWPDEKILLECEGAIWSGGRHTRGSGYLQDVVKYNEAALRGYTLLRTTPATLCKPETIELIRRALERTEAA